jgi:deoxyadenosine/deoxycytidine kinase
MSITKSSIIELLNSLAKSDIVDGENMIVHLFDTEKDKGPFIVSIEGNIGAGKSTLLEKMRKIYVAESEDPDATRYFGKLAEETIIFMQEPVDLWETFRDSVTGETVLEKFYKDPKAFSLAFQVMAYNTMLQGFRKTIRENPHCKLIICERSLNASYHIFSQMLHDDGMIDNVSFQIYMNMYNSNRDEVQLDAVLHLDVDSEICLQRIGKRSRDGESSISLDYLKKCDRYYKKWLNNNPAV